ncbi:hypothetical protein ADK57_13295 [Streptomyces sp. MMG1533]|nr:hypothetical protein ADK57_13295 [Streptomyces sp. MMG1533]
MHGQPAVADLIEGGEGTRRVCGEDDARPVRQDRADPLGVGGDELGDLEGVGRGGVVGDEGVVEAAVVQGAGVPAQMPDVQAGTARGGRSRGPGVGVDGADELDRHGNSSVRKVS